MFGKVLVGSNATAAAASLAFIGAFYAKNNQHEALKLGASSAIFVVGFICSVICLALICTRARETLVADISYFQEIMDAPHEVRWDTNPNLKNLRQETYIFAISFGIFAGFFFLLGVMAFMFTLVLI